MSGRDGKEALGMELIKPEQKYLQSYYEACLETWGYVHDGYILHNPAEYDKWKTHIFEDYENQEKGIGLSEGFVSSVTFWAVDGDKYIGTVNIRPELSERLKEYGGHIGIVIRKSCRKMGYGESFGKMALNKVFQMGVKEVLLTCEETNIGSRRILEKFNPEKTEKAVVLLNGKQTPVLRYYFKKK